MSPERKQLFLSQLREKGAELKRQKLLHRSNSIVSFVEVDSRRFKRKALTINTSSLSPEEASPATPTRGNRTADCLCIFEMGSTSVASDAQSRLSSAGTAKRGLTSGASDAENTLSSAATARRGSEMINEEKRK